MTLGAYSLNDDAHDTLFVCGVEGTEACHVFGWVLSSKALVWQFMKYLRFFVVPSAEGEGSWPL